MQTLTYPIAIRCSSSEQIINTLFFFRHVINFYLRQFFNSEVIEKLDEKKKAYKCLEKISEQKRYYIPSRINRGLLEIAGRILRSLKDRKQLYSLLKSIEEDAEKWDYNLLKNNGIYKKSQYIENLKEQAINYLQEFNILPDDYLSIITPPKKKNGMITFSPDDGQAIKLEVEEDKINISLKVIKEDKNEPLKRSERYRTSLWEWIDFSVCLPDIVAKKDQFKYKKPDLRLDFIGGRLTPVLDLKVSVIEEDKKDSKNFLTVDWGLNKLVTICVFNSEGEQISRPFFLNCSAIQSKLFRIRKEIDNLKAKRDKLPNGSTWPVWRYRASSLALWYNREIAQKWNKYRAIQKQLSHLASNVIVEIAKIYNCSKIYVEWLGSLKSRKFSKTVNWKINSQVRQQIYEKVEYKARLAGITLERPINPAFTSQFCPKCGKRGYHVKAPDRLDERKKSGGWFYCKKCGYNADRDYVATQNIARLALFGSKLKGMSKAFAYKTKAISDKLFRQSIEAISRLRDNLNGWKNTVFLRPVYLVAGTLRL